MKPKLLKKEKRRKRVHAFGFSKGLIKVPECPGDSIVVLVDDQGSPLHPPSPVPHLSLSPSHPLARN